MLTPLGTQGLIVENTFTGIAELASHLFTILKAAGPLLGLLLQNKWRSLDIISKCGKIPILFLSGGKDEIIPPAHMDALKKRCNGADGTSFRRWPEAHHNDVPLIAGPDYYACVSAFLEGAMYSPPID